MDWIKLTPDCNLVPALICLLSAKRNFTQEKKQHLRGNAAPLILAIIDHAVTPRVEMGEPAWCSC